MPKTFRPRATSYDLKNSKTDMKTKFSNLISGLIVAAMIVMAGTALISSTTGRLQYR